MITFPSVLIWKSRGQAKERWNKRSDPVGLHTCFLTEIASPFRYKRYLEEQGQGTAAERHHVLMQP